MPKGAIWNQPDRAEVDEWVQLAVDDSTRASFQTTKTGWFLARCSLRDGAFWEPAPLQLPPPHMLHWRHTHKSGTIRAKPKRIIPRVTRDRRTDGILAISAGTP